MRSGAMPLPTKEVPACPKFGLAESSCFLFCLKNPCWAHTSEICYLGYVCFGGMFFPCNIAMALYPEKWQ